MGHPSQDPFTTLVDALSRGRLAPAELMAVSSLELDAMFELAAERMDAGRHEDAVTLLLGLVGLYPFCAKYWRALGVALHRQLNLQHALGAYNVALYLEPGQMDIICYRGEVLLYLGEKERCRIDLEQARDSGRLDLKRRATTLLGQLTGLSRWTPQPTPEPVRDPAATLSSFSLRDGRLLPLGQDESLFNRPAKQEPIKESTVVRMAPVVAQLREPKETTNGAVALKTTPFTTMPLREVTHVGTPHTATALIPGRQLANELRNKKQTQQAALVHDHTHTAVLPGRLPTPQSSDEEVTQTAVAMRRQRQALTTKVTETIE